MFPVLRISALALVPFLAVPVVVASQKPDPDDKEIGSYRLTMAALKKVANVNRVIIAHMRQDATFQEVVKIEKEISSLESKDELTETDEQRLEKLRERQEQLEDAVDNPLGGDTKNLDEMEARIRKYAPLMAALQKEGMAPREYAKFWMAFIQAAFAQGFKKSGMVKELPPGVNPENVKFVEDHAAEIEAMQKEFQALEKQ